MTPHDQTADQPVGQNTAPGVDRRHFLRGLAAGAGSVLILGAELGATSSRVLVQGLDESGDLAEAFAPSLWLAIDDKGAVTIWAHRSEMGTGIRTSLPMVVADELGADWDRVTLAQALGDARYGSQNTDGSRSIRRFYEVMRRAGSAARMMLEEAAAKQWGVGIDACEARDHAVHGPDGNSIAFGDLVAAARELTPPADDALQFKPADQRRYVGKENVKFYDLDDIVTGTGKFGADVRPEGMVFAAIWRTPVLGGKIQSFDAAEAKKVRGVLDVVELPGFSGPAPAFQALGGVAVVASNTFAAMKGRDALKIDWEPGDRGSFDSAEFAKAMQATSQQDGSTVRDEGDAQKAFADAAGKPQAATADYSVPFLAHAAMEPLSALAIAGKDSCEVWAPTQNPQAAQGVVAQTLGLDPTKVKVHVTLLGGGFGRKSKPDSCAEAAILSKALGGKPVRVQWSREDDMRFDFYHSPAAVRLQAVVGDNGIPTAWLGRSVFPPIGTTFNPSEQAAQPSAGELGLGFTDVPYAIPNIHLEAGPARAGTRIGWLRSVHHIQHAFAECSFVDELAAKAGRDRVEFLDELIGEPRIVDMSKVEYPNQGEPLEKFPVDTGRLKTVMHHVAKEAGWGRKLPKGRGLGIAVHRSFLSYVAVVVEVDVQKDGTLTIQRLDIGLDCGLVVNPDRVRAQLEGGSIFGLSVALMGEITFADGAVVQSNFHDYPVTRHHEAPKVLKTHLLPNEAIPSGVGEPGTPPIAPAVCNAIFAATGKRIRDLPIRKHDLSWS